MPLNDAQKGWLSGLLGTGQPVADASPAAVSDKAKPKGAPGGPSGSGRVTGPIFDTPAPPNADPNIAAIDDAIGGITSASATLFGAGLDPTPHLQAIEALRKAVEGATKLKEPARTVVLAGVRLKGVAALATAQAAVAQGLPPVRKRLEAETRDLIKKALDGITKLPDTNAQKADLSKRARTVDTQLQAGPAKNEAGTELGKMVWIQRLHFLSESVSRDTEKAVGDQGALPPRR